MPPMAIAQDLPISLSAFVEVINETRRHVAATAQTMKPTIIDEIAFKPMLQGIFFILRSGKTKIKKRKRSSKWRPLLKK